jgi:C-terminal processing protease CtpA/Prc
VEKSPAEKAGLKEGDLLLKANETPLSSTDVLNNLVRESQGREISLEIMRAGKKSQIKLAAAEQGNNPSFREIQIGSQDGIGYMEMLNYDLGTVSAQRPRTEAATLERLAKAVDQLTKEVGELRTELKKK